MQTPLKILTDDIRQQIKLFNKKHIDISGLINGYSIVNENLSNSYISELNMSERNMSDCNLSNSTIKLILNNGIANRCNFTFCQFLDGTCFRGADLRYSNFNYGNAANADFSYARLENTNLCDLTFTIFSKKVYKARFSKDLLELLKRFVIIEGLNDNQ